MANDNVNKGRHSLYKTGLAEEENADQPVSAFDNINEYANWIRKSTFSNRIIEQNDVGEISNGHFEVVGPSHSRETQLQN
jgi:hypothetical protein